MPSKTLASSTKPVCAVRITGVVESSRYYTERGTQQPVHELLLGQGDHQLRVLARRSWPNTAANHLVAQRLAASFKPGHRATVTARNWQLNPVRQLLELVGTDHCEQAGYAPESSNEEASTTEGIST